MLFHWHLLLLLARVCAVCMYLCVWLTSAIAINMPTLFQDQLFIHNYCAYFFISLYFYFLSLSILLYSTYIHLCYGFSLKYPGFVLTSLRTCAWTFNIVDSIRPDIIPAPFVFPSCLYIYILLHSASLFFIPLDSICLLHKYWAPSSLSEITFLSYSPVTLIITSSWRRHNTMCHPTACCCCCWWCWSCCCCWCY